MIKAITKIVVDQTVSETELRHFKAFARRRSLPTEDSLFVLDFNTTQPNGDLVSKHLDHSTILVTKDRPLHNKALSEGLRSFYIGEGRITDRPLHGAYLRQRQDRPLQSRYAGARGNSRRPDYPRSPSGQRKPESRTFNKRRPERRKPDATKSTSTAARKPQTQAGAKMRPILLPSSDHGLKRISDKRRYIRSYYGGPHRMDEAFVTISWHALADETLFGMRVRITSRVGLKAIDAAESYVLEKIDPEHRNAVALGHAMIFLNQLMLNTLPTTIYFDARKVDIGSLQLDKIPDDYRLFLLALNKCFEKLAIEKTSRGLFVQKLRSMLGIAAKYQHANGVVSGDFDEYLRKFKLARI